MLSYDINKSIQNNICLCSHKSECKINMYGQCIYNFNLQCKNCKYGLKNIYDKCKNNECYLYMQKIINIDLENDIFEKDFLEEYISDEDNFDEDNSDGNISEENIKHKTHEYFHYGPCMFNEYGQCKKGWRYFCSCGYGIGSYYDECKTKKCVRYKSTQKQSNNIKPKL